MNITKCIIKTAKYIGLLLLSILVAIVLYTLYLLFLTPKYKIVRIGNNGLGNQLYNFAFAYALQQKSNAKVLLDISPIQRKAGHTLSWIRYFGNDYKYEFKLWQDEENLIARSIRRSVLSKHIIETSPFVYQKEALDIEDKNIFYQGYRQNYLYFDKYRQKIIDIFKELKEGFDKDAVELIKEMKGHKNSVMINARFGDYMSNQYKNAFYLCKEDYYNTAIKMFENMDDVFFFISTDDIKTAEKVLKFNKKNYKFIKSKTYVTTLILSSNTKHNIISNSTFAWWAAYLNDNKNKKIIAPKYWYRNSDGSLVKSENLFPKDFDVSFIDNVKQVAN